MIKLEKNPQPKMQFELVTDGLFNICDYIPAPFNTKDNDFDSQVSAIFNADYSCTCGFCALGFVAEIPLRVWASGASANILHIRTIDFPANLPFEDIMLPFTAGEWYELCDKAVHSFEMSCTFVLHDWYNEMYIHIHASEDSITMIFTADTKKED